jgi:hypothetical protein
MTKCIWQPVEQNYAFRMLSDEDAKLWTPWEEVCHVEEHRMSDEHEGKKGSYRCSFCHFDTSTDWTPECPNPMCVIESFAVAQGWVLK